VRVKKVLSIVLAFVIGGIAGYFARDLPALLSKDEDLPTQLEQGEYAGNDVLEVTIQKKDGSVLAGIEVDLWADGKQEGPPTAAIEETDTRGIATFNLKPGTYWLGYNLENWPEDLEIPVGQTELTVESGKTNSVTIILKARQGE
jgi:hypothetical protein